MNEAHAKHLPVAGAWDAEPAGSSKQIITGGLKRPVLPVWLQDGLLALWVTNRERLRRFVEAELLPAWGLAPAAQWLWLKVTARGALVTPLVTACPAASDIYAKTWVDVTHSSQRPAIHAMPCRSVQCRWAAAVTVEVLS